MTWNASNFNERLYKSHLISIIKLFVCRQVVGTLIICGFKYLMIISLNYVLMSLVNNGFF
jgi:hypothetical protein